VPSRRGCRRTSGKPSSYEPIRLGRKIVGPLIGPIVAVVSFVCSIGNVPLAAVLWNGGISFGGVIALLFADLIVLPILDIYRRSSGLRIALLLLGVSYAAMAGAAHIVELIFGVAGLVPQQRSAQILEAHIAWNYTTWLNELHDLAKHRVPRIGCAPGMAFHENRWPGNASHDEPTGPGGNPPAFLRWRLSDRAACYSLSSARSFFADP
jgi:predicted permease